MNNYKANLNNISEKIYNEINSDLWYGDYIGSISIEYDKDTRLKELPSFQDIISRVTKFIDDDKDIITSFDITLTIINYEIKDTYIEVDYNWEITGKKEK